MRLSKAQARRTNRALTPLQRLLIHAALLLLCLPAILPFLWMIATSLKTDTEVYASTGSFSITALIPHALQFRNYPDALRTVPLATYLINTLALCGTTVIGSVLSSAIVAYGFARMTFWGRDALFVVMISTMALPSQVTMIPTFLIYRALGWYGTYLPLVVPSFTASAFFVFLLTQFFRTLPNEMAESARLDGCSEWKIFTRMILPLSRPALATCALFSFMGTWNDFMGPLLYIDDPKKYTLAYGLQQFYSSYGGKWTQLMAASAMFTVPIIILFFFAQKTFIQGIATTGGRN